MREFTILLHNVRSAHNVGSIFRTADAAGVKKIYLSGYTPIPIDRFGRAQKKIAKTALGAEKFLQWEYCKSPMRAISKLKKEKWKIVGVEQHARAKDYSSIRTNRPIVFAFGNEVRGLSKNILNVCDEILEIPMHGAMVRQAHHPRHSGRGKESLNVSVAAGIILFSVR